MKRYSFPVALLVIFFFAGCATLGTEINKDNNQIQMPHYSFAVPPDQGWHLLRPDEKSEVAITTMKAGPFTFQMKMMRNVILGENLKAASAKTVADDFRNIEKQIMIEQGVNKGLYQLRELAMGEETVGDKKIFTMNYVILADTGTQKVSLYLYFPKDESNDYFIIAHYSETVPPNAFLVKSFKPEFLEALKSLRVSQ
jgi:hypothetical protein